MFLVLRNARISPDLRKVPPSPSSCATYRRVHIPCAAQRGPGHKGLYSKAFTQRLSAQGTVHKGRHSVANAQRLSEQGPGDKGQGT